MFKYKPDTIGFIMKRQCNGGCDFCGINSTKEPGEKLTPEIMKDCIGQAYQLGIESVGLTGGDPFDLEEVTDIISYVASKGMPSRLMTNGSYAKTLDEGERYARSLKEAGASMIRVSVDETHGKAIPYECSFNAIKGALNQGLGVTIASAYKMSTALKSREMLEKLAKDLNGYVDNYGHKHPGYIRIVAGEKQVPILMAFINNAGRARNLDRNEFFWYEPDPSEGCQSNQLIVNSNGNIMPCDSMFSLELDELYAAGNVYGTRLSDAMKGISEDSMIAFLKGPEGGKRLLDLLESSPEPEVSNIAKKKVTHFCEVCSDAMRNESARKLIEKAMKA